MRPSAGTTHARALVVAAAVLIAVGVSIVPGGPALAWNAPNDPMFKDQYGPVQIGAVDAWAKTTGQGVIVAVVDTGVDVDHPDLKGKLVAGRDFGDGDNNPDDDSEFVSEENGQKKPLRGHGTHVAGTIAAATNNGEGVAGVAPDAKIMGLKIAEKNGFGNWAQTAPQAIRYAVDNGAKVINLSILSYVNPLGLVRLDSLEGPCNDAYRRGSLCVIAAGNSGSDQPSGYTRDLNALLVTANDADGKHAPFGQKADTKWALSAPGVAIRSTYPLEDGAYKDSHGTSMAAPHAAGVAALLFAQGLPVDQVVKRMLDTAVAIGDPATNGAGIVNAQAASGAERTDPPTTATQEQRSSGNVLLPRAATRTTTARKPPTAPPPTAQPAADAGAQPSPTTLPLEENPDAFAADLGPAAEGTGETALTTSRRPDDASQIGFYSAAVVAAALVVATGLSTLARVRQRRA